MLAKLFGHQPPASRQVAKERLRLVLVHDRIKMSPAMLDEMREELIGVLSQHLEVDRDNMQLTFTQGKRLLVDIPVRETRAKGKRVGAK